MDFLLVKEREELKHHRHEIIERKTAVTQEVTDLKIAGGVASKFNSGILQPHIIKAIGDDKFQLRNQLTKELIRLEGLLHPINKRLSELHDIEYKEQNSGQIIKDVLKEIFTEDQFLLIMKEVNNREIGLPPTKVCIGIENSINQKLVADKYRKLAQQSLDSLILARRQITSCYRRRVQTF